MNKAVVQICAFCWLYLLPLIMHGTNIKMSRVIRTRLNFLYHQRYSTKISDIFLGGFLVTPKPFVQKGTWSRMYVSSLIGVARLSL
jgi:hypothetical protein